MITITKETKSGVQMLAQLQMVKSNHLSSLGQQDSLGLSKVFTLTQFKLHTSDDATTLLLKVIYIEEILGGLAGEAGMAGVITTLMLVGIRMLTMVKYLIAMATIGGNGVNQHCSAMLGGGHHFGPTGRTMMLMTNTLVSISLGIGAGVGNVYCIAMFLAVGLGIMNGVMLTSKDMLFIMASTIIIGRLPKFSTIMQLLTHSQMISSATDGQQHSQKCLAFQRLLKEPIFLHQLKIMNCLLMMQVCSQELYSKLMMTFFTKLFLLI